MLILCRGKRALPILALILLGAHLAPSAARTSDPEPAPIVERSLDFHDFTLKTIDGGSLNLREFAASKRLVIIAYVAGWCNNSNQNAAVVKRLYDKFKDRGLGLVAVAEYSTPEEVRMHINRIGADYPVAVETEKLNARKKSQHYRYRQAVGDKRKWGTPFYVILDRSDILPAASGSPLARRVHTVSGEMVESEAEQFLEQRLGK